MKTVIEGQALVIQPRLAEAIGFNEALFLQQLYYTANFTSEGKGTERWVTRTYTEWNGCFTFWSIGTVRRTIASLEKQQLIISKLLYRQTKLIRTKAYRINRSHPLLVKLQNRADAYAQNEPAERTICTAASAQNDAHLPHSTYRQLLKENKEKEKNIDSAAFFAGEIHTVIHHLNEKTGKQFSPANSETRKLIADRLQEGRTLEQLLHVIGIKCAQWLDDERRCGYLRPSTLFSERNFDNYVNERPLKQAPKQTDYEPITLQFSKGENGYADRIN